MNNKKWGPGRGGEGFSFYKKERGFVERGRTAGGKMSGKTNAKKRDNIDLQRVGSLALKGGGRLRKKRGML